VDKGDKRLMDPHVSEKMHKAFKQLMDDFIGEPDLILESEDRPEITGQTLTEIRSKLFGRRANGGCAGNRADR